MLTVDEWSGDDDDDDGDGEVKGIHTGSIVLN
jgi:hypothetical protein